MRVPCHFQELSYRIFLRPFSNVGNKINVPERKIVFLRCQSMRCCRRRCWRRHRCRSRHRCCRCHRRCSCVSRCVRHSATSSVGRNHLSCFIAPFQELFVKLFDNYDSWKKKDWRGCNGLLFSEDSISNRLSKKQLNKILTGKKTSTIIHQKSNIKTSIIL